ncbi:hypothetical protein [Kitasatospora griseola]|uniref:hypothetical protein n=1 Tax=Kitasatospora griseola TaxID=2064 RepID=UPI000AA726C8|nr:hypothetical protein [Kitasatospora griseola]
MSTSSTACGLCGITRRQHDIQWVDTVPHRWVPPTVAQALSRTEQVNPRKQAAR